jgi:hypothetical protein
MKSPFEDQLKKSLLEHTLDNMTPEAKIEREGQELLKSSIAYIKSKGYDVRHKGELQKPQVVYRGASPVVLQAGVKVDDWEVADRNENFFFERVVRGLFDQMYPELVKHIEISKSYSHDDMSSNYRGRLKVLPVDEKEGYSDVVYPYDKRTKYKEAMLA